MQSSPYVDTFEDMPEKNSPMASFPSFTGFKASILQTSTPSAIPAPSNGVAMASLLTTSPHTLPFSKTSTYVSVTLEICTRRYSPSRVLIREGETARRGKICTRSKRSNLRLSSPLPSCLSHGKKQSGFALMKF